LIGSSVSGAKLALKAPGRAGTVELVSTAELYGTYQEQCLKIRHCNLLGDFIPRNFFLN